MIRQMIKIDEERCNGCGLCAKACHEGAIGMVNGKAKLLRDDYCDGLGNCLPVCPTGAISFEQREAVAFDEEAANAKTHRPDVPDVPASAAPSPQPLSGNPGSQGVSELLQWPVQIKLMPVRAPYYDGAHLLIAADCAAYANGSFHDTYMKGRITMIGCPKLDEGDYAEKLTEILRQNAIASVLVIRMEVPCCGGLSNAAITALKNCNKMIPWQTVTLSTRGEVQ